MGRFVFKILFADGIKMAGRLIVLRGHGSHFDCSPEVEEIGSACNNGFEKRPTSSVVDPI